VLLLVFPPNPSSFHPTFADVMSTNNQKKKSQELKRSFLPVTPSACQKKGGMPKCREIKVVEKLDEVFVRKMLCVLAMHRSSSIVPVRPVSVKEINLASHVS